MKKFTLIALAACVALAACTKNEVRPVSADQEITFETAVYKASSKALISTTSYPQTASFGTVAYRESSGTPKYFGPEEVSYNSTKYYWSTATAYYWPVNDALTFMSYSPFKYQESAHSSTAITVTDSYNQLAISDYDVAAHQETDLMVADIQKEQKANTTQQGGTWQKGVPTIFHHKLSQIVAINFQTVDTQDPSTKKDYAYGRDGSSAKPYLAGDQQFFLNEVALCKTCFTGSYEYTYDDASSAVTKDEWTKGSAIVDKTLWFTEPSALQNVVGKFVGGEIVPHRTDNIGNPATNNYILILPQTFESYTLGNESTVPHIYIKYTVRTYYADNKLNTDVDGFSDETIETVVPLYDIHSSDHTWAMNKKITYTFNLTKQRIYWDPQVVNWDSESHTVEI
ncbi:MAG: fimbrillin family protein [Candidatus Cryptobacteroides sp.]|nr:fimbrillin family protein [Candidatus Cryptobacteroides sp.]